MGLVCSSINNPDIIFDSEGDFRSDLYSLMNPDAYSTCTEAIAAIDLRDNDCVDDTVELACLINDGGSSKIKVCSGTNLYLPAISDRFSLTTFYIDTTGIEKIECKSDCNIFRHYSVSEDSFGLPSDQCPLFVSEFDSKLEIKGFAYFDIGPATGLPDLTESNALSSGTATLFSCTTAEVSSAGVIDKLKFEGDDYTPSSKSGKGSNDETTRRIEVIRGNNFNGRKNGLRLKTRSGTIPEEDVVHIRDAHGHGKKKNNRKTKQSRIQRGLTPVDYSTKSDIVYGFFDCLDTDGDGVISLLERATFHENAISCIDNLM